jgi:hypothetical protein
MLVHGKNISMTLINAKKKADGENVTKVRVITRNGNAKV